MNCVDEIHVGEQWKTQNEGEKPSALMTEEGDTITRAIQVADARIALASVPKIGYQGKLQDKLLVFPALEPEKTDSSSRKSADL